MSFRRSQGMSAARKDVCLRQVRSSMRELAQYLKLLEFPTRDFAPVTLT